MLQPFDDFTRAYLECALWTSDPDPGSGEWSESDWWNIDAIDPEDLAEQVRICWDFQDANRADLDELNAMYHTDDTQHGHDFWLTRNRHGAGFWDRGYDQAIADRLTKASHVYGEAYVYGPETEDNGRVSDAAFDEWDGVIHIQ